MRTVHSAPGLTFSTLKCDCAGCASQSPALHQWPGGSWDVATGWKGAVGPRVKNTRTRYDVCPECAAAGKLPPKAESPQPWAMASA